MEINVLSRVFLVIILTILIYIFSKVNIYQYKIKPIKYLYIFFAPFIPVFFYLFTPDIIGIANIFYITFFLAVIVLVGLVFSLFIRKNNSPEN